MTDNSKRSDRSIGEKLLKTKISEKNQMKPFGDCQVCNDKTKSSISCEACKVNKI